MSWDTVSPGYRPLSWGYAGVPRMPPVSQDANSRFQTLCGGVALVSAVCRRPPPRRVGGVGGRAHVSAFLAHTNHHCTVPTKFVSCAHNLKCSKPRSSPLPPPDRPPPPVTSLTASDRALQRTDRAYLARAAAAQAWMVKGRESAFWQQRLERCTAEPKRPALWPNVAKSSAFGGASGRLQGWTAGPKPPML